MYGKKSKVLKFPTLTVKKTDYTFLNDTGIERSRKKTYQKMNNWPTILGSCIGTMWMISIIYLSAKVIYG